jgi:hypothetical protein
LSPNHADANFGVRPVTVGYLQEVLVALVVEHSGVCVPRLLDAGRCGRLATGDGFGRATRSALAAMRGAPRQERGDGFCADPSGEQRLASPVITVG